MTSERKTDLLARERWRLWKDRGFGAVMAVGGIAVIVAILLIFFYLFYVVLPLFGGATVTARTTLRTAPTAAVMVALDEYADTGFKVAANGHYEFFASADGRILTSGELAERAHADITAVAAGEPATQAVFAGTAHGTALVAKVDYVVTYPHDQRVVTPKLSFPLAERVLRVSTAGDAVRLITGQSAEDETTVAAVTASGRVVVVSAVKESSLLDDEEKLTVSRHPLELEGDKVTQLAMDVDQRELLVVTNDGVLSLFDIRDKKHIELIDRTSVIGSAGRLTAMAFVSGGISILIGDDLGVVTQWFPVRDAHNNYALERVREFPPLPAAVAHIAPEYFRKGFAAIDVEGNLGIYHTTSARQLVQIATQLQHVTTLALGPRGDAAVAATADGALQIYSVHNPHPEVSFKALWGEVWYESRDRPEYIWQSSSASSDFEPKFSLTPLTFGTLKAAGYSMLFAVPLAVLGAIYTAYFMTPFMRGIVKPSIEVMAALPTVILGFLAGLWLAPLVERELLGILASVILVPAAILLLSLAWSRAPGALRRWLPDGWEALVLVPVVCGAVWLSLVLGTALEAAFFDGSVTHWLNVEYGLTYDQRNSLVVAIAIGFAVIPTIFSISEDAVFSVPRHLTMGSLALGATPWQTAIKVVLLTASPGIFSAVMIGMGRAVGETMIVLMATGNTPIMDLNIFQGFRALSANIAVEMPESEVNSTHYRVLFLAALVLFIVTFGVNTLAELVRQRLRRKYSSL